MISSVFSKWNHMEELNPKTELDTICTNNPPKEFASFSLFFNVTWKSLRWESRSYSYSRYLPHVVLSVSKAGIKIHTDICLREEAKFSLCEKPHVPSVSAQPERQKWTESHVSLQSKQNTDFRNFRLQNTASSILHYYVFYYAVQFTILQRFVSGKPEETIDV